MEKIIHFTVPEKLTPVQAQCVECARALHPTWEIKVWQDPVRPYGCLLEKYWPKVNSGAQLSDLLRLDILYRWGGVYVDGDLRLLKPLDDLINEFDFFLASETGNSLEGAIIGVRMGHPAIKGLIDDLLLNEPDWSLSPDKTTGPDLFARVLKWNKCVTVLPRDTFYCYAADAQYRKRHRHSYGEHLWDWSWKYLYPEIGVPTRLSGLSSRAKRLVKPAFRKAFRILHRIKSVDPLASEKAATLWQPRFYSRSRELVVQTEHGFNIILDGNDTSITPALVFGGYERAAEAFVKRILHGGDWVVDVGASVGLFSMLAGQCVGGFGRVFTFEPNPWALKLLSRSTVMNSMHDRIVVRPVAVGDVFENVKLAFDTERLGDGQVGHSEIMNSAFSVSAKILGTENLVEVNVPQVTLDQEFPVDLPIKLLKVDVEGCEVAVLKGARRLLERRCIDFILIEVMSEVAGSRWTELITQMKRLTEANHIACTLAKDGSLVEHKSLPAALAQLRGRNIVLKAREQYTYSAWFDGETSEVSKSVLKQSLEPTCQEVD